MTLRLAGRFQVKGENPRKIHTVTAMKIAVMRGMNSQNGLAIKDGAHLQQSIADILRTPLKSRVMLPDYGSELFNLIDAPMNEETKLRFFAASAIAINRWEKRVSVIKVEIADVEDGKVTLNLYMIEKVSGSLISIKGITL